MYNHNRAVAEAEQERFQRMKTARERQVPYHLRRDGFKQATGWLSEHIGEPVAGVSSDYYGIVSHKVLVWYRRTSTRIAGLVMNTLEGLWDMAPGSA
jgi:hypothetical protein